MLCWEHNMLWRYYISNTNKSQVCEEVSGVKKEFEISLDSKTLDQAIEKANRLAELLREVQQMIDSLFGKEKSES
nr:MAG TPA: hypothetical protein [Caudoviricetes sp.]